MSYWRFAAMIATSTLVLGAGPLCRFAYAPDDAPVAAASAAGAGASRGVIKLHGRLVPMNVQYQTSPDKGFELSSDDVTVVASSYQEGTGDAREADALLRIGRDLEVGYGGFYECSR